MGVITNANISVTVPYGTDITSLIADFTISGTKVQVNGVDQASTQTPNDFSSPVKYTVVAADGSTKDYTVSVTVAPNSAKDITQYALGGVVATISNTNISVTVPYGTDLKGLIAEFTISGTKVQVNGIDQVSTQTPNDFSKPVKYTVVAADGSTKDYTVIAIVAPSNAKEIKEYILAGAVATISNTNITVTVPFGSNLKSLIAEFTIAGTKVQVNGVDQVSKQTPNDFSKPVKYTVVAADQSTKDYTVTVTVNSTPPIVAVGKGGAVLYSSDNGKTWENEAVGLTSEELFGVIYHDGLYIAVGTNGVIITSNDGKSWSKSTSGTNAVLRAITYDNESNLYYAVGHDKTALTSSDGLSWTNVKPDLKTVTAFDFTCVKATSHVSASFKYLPIIGCGSGSGDNLWLFSPAGWMAYHTGGLNYTYKDISNFNDTKEGYYVAVGNDGIISISKTGVNTWYAIKNTGSINNELRSVIYVNGVYYVVGVNVIKSFNVNVTSTGNPVVAETQNFVETPIEARFNKVIYYSGQFVAFAEHGIVMTSPDFVKWNLISVPTTENINSGTFGVNEVN